ncbi:hypothetical protein [Caenispirillum bisanense]|uniref:hypothetical protein n=1 Tax=Caenispirillum bisanense TaxID=414052 RepID=UPI0031D98433
MEHIEELARQSGKRHTSLSLFLALYLMLLAFFITLLSLSTFEEDRQTRAVDSVNAAFNRFETTSLGRFTGDAGLAVQEARSFHEELEGLFEAAIPAVKITHRSQGRVMEVDLPVEALFVPGEARLREPHLRLLDRIVAGLSTAPRGYRYVMEFVTGSDYPTGELLPLAETLAMARAGVLARTLVERGAPPAAVVVGVSPLEAGRARMTFTMADEAADRPDLSRPLAEPVPQAPEDAEAGAAPDADAGPAQE